MQRFSRQELQDRFISKAKVVHNGFYDYSKVAYVKSYLPVTITCPIHGDYRQIPHNHLRYPGCPGCKADNQSKRQSLTQDEYVARSKYLWGDKYSYERAIYVRSSANITITCNKHLTDFTINANTHLTPSKVHQCPYCRLEVTKKKLGTLEQFVATAKYDLATFFVLRSSGIRSSESFFRIGITTSPGGLSRTIRATPYNTLVVYSEEMSAADAYKLETNILVGNREFHYEPMLRFTGAKNQCFSELDLTKFI